MVRHNAYVSLVFPSIGVTTQQRKSASLRAAKDFAESFDVGEPALLKGDAYGFSVPTDASAEMFAAASARGARVLQEVDTKVNADEGTPSPVPGAKKAVERKKLKPVKEGTWIDIKKAVSALKFEMDGPEPVSEAEPGRLRPGRYYVLGITEARNGSVATLGRVSNLKDIGQAGVGRFVYNVVVPELSECMDDPSTVKKLGGGVVGATPKAIDKKKPTSKKESQETQIEERVTEESSHSRGLKILRLMQEKEKAAAIAEAPQKEVKKAEGKEAKQITESKNKEAKLANPLDLPDLDAGLETRIDLLFAESGGSMSNIQINEDDAEELTNNQEADSIDGAETLDPATFGKKDEDEADDAESEDEAEEDKEEAYDDAFTNEGEEEGVLFEDLLPGDVTSSGGILSVLKKRNYENAEQIAQKLQNNSPASEWFSLTGGSLQDAKRLQWLYQAANR